MYNLPFSNTIIFSVRLSRFARKKHNLSESMAINIYVWWEIYSIENGEKSCSREKRKEENSVIGNLWQKFTKWRINSKQMPRIKGTGCKCFFKYYFNMQICNGKICK